MSELVQPLREYARERVVQSSARFVLLAPLEMRLILTRVEDEHGKLDEGGNLRTRNS